MHPNHHFFKVVKPFRLYRFIGTYPSNSYYGSSQVHMPHYEARNATKGDEIRVIPGGTFHFERSTGTWWAVDLSPPKGAFEKTYGLTKPDYETLDARKGTVERKTASAIPMDHAEIRSRQVAFDTYKDPVREVEPSPERVAFARLTSAAAKASLTKKALAQVTSKGTRLHVAETDLGSHHGVAWRLTAQTDQAAAAHAPTVLSFSSRRFDGLIAVETPADAAGRIHARIPDDVRATLRPGYGYSSRLVDAKAAKAAMSAYVKATIDSILEAGDR